MNKTVLTEKDHLDIKKLRGKLSVKNIQKNSKSTKLGWKESTEYLIILSL